MGFFSSIGHFVENAANTVANGVTSVGNTIANTLDPHLQELENQYNSLVNSYNATRLGLVNASNEFQSTLQDYQSMAACNGTLLICSQAYHWTDTQFNDFLKQTQNPPPFKPVNAVPGDIAGFISRATGSNLIVSYLTNPVNVESLGLQQVSQLVGLGSIGGDIGSVLGELSTLTSGLSIGGMVLGNIIEGEVEYPKQIRKLQGMYDDLRGKYAQVNTAISSLKSGIATERAGFLRSMAQLTQIAPASFPWQLQSTDPDTAYQQAMVAAVSQYGIVFRLRQDWAKYAQNVGDGQYAQFLQLEQCLVQSGQYTPQQVSKFLWLIAQSTTGGLNQAWQRAGRPSPA